MAAAAAVWFLGRGPAEPEERPPLLATQLTSEIGEESHPTFSPDGTRIADVVGAEFRKADIYVRHIGAGAPVQLTANEKNDVTPV